MYYVVIINVLNLHSLGIIERTVNLVCRRVNLNITMIFCLGKPYNSITLDYLTLVENYRTVTHKLKSVVGIFALNQLYDIVVLILELKDMYILLDNLYLDKLLPSNTIVSSIILNSTGWLVESG